MSPPRRAIVLCAGFGTRLRPLTSRLPKPLVPVGLAPLLDHTLDWLAAVGVGEVVLNAHHRAEALVTYAAARPPGARPRVLHVEVEPEIRGTAGGLRGLAPWVAHEEVFLMVNGDVLVDLDLGPLLARHVAEGRDATMVLTDRSVPGARPVGADAAGRLVSLAGYLDGDDLSRARQSGTFTGIHLLGPAMLDLLETTDFDVNRELYPRAHRAGLSLWAETVPGYWRDLGTLDAYMAAHRDLLRGRGPAAPRGPAVGFWDRTNRVLVDARAHLGAGVQLGRDVIVGAHCRVGAGARLDNALLWPAARVAPRRQLSDVLVVPASLGGDLVPLGQPAP